MNAKDTLLKSAAAFGAAVVLLVAFVLPAHPQVRPAKLTPSVDAAASGESFRVDIDPVIGMRGREAENLRMVLRQRRVRKSQPVSEIELDIAEYHGSWFLVRMPQEARFPRGRLGGGLLKLLNQRGDVLASCTAPCLSILAAPRAGQAAPGSGAAAAGPAPGSADPSGRPDPRRAREERRARQQGMTAPSASAQAQEAQVMTAPSMSATAKRLPTPVTDYVGIATTEIVLKKESQTHLSAFSLPSDVRLDDRAVLMFIANPDDTETELKISINGHEIKRLNFHEGAARTFHVRFNAKGILRSGRNELGLSGHEISAGGPFGRSERKVRVDDIVLWFHRDIH